MFYSQFILAKKGPLGTIWIAAHLERKLRKNQVADTDIGVSVDSILSPEVPIALRLSSHLLLGVVRIYSRKVNYLFHDCSEALLKVKQAFRSTAVDLPPEESTAPYHSITLPETFDLDDFELPDSDNFQGNFVDHHVSTREQITLQDSMDGVLYSTSQFGLDERFGDGDTSQGLDLDEDLFFDKVTAAGHSAVLLDLDMDTVDPQVSGQPMTPFIDMDIYQDDYQTMTNDDRILKAALTGAKGANIDSISQEEKIVDHPAPPCDDRSQSLNFDGHGFTVKDIGTSSTDPSTELVHCAPYTPRLVEEVVPTNSHFDEDHAQGPENEILQSNSQEVVVQDFTNNLQCESEYHDKKLVAQDILGNLGDLPSGILNIQDTNDGGNSSLLDNKSSETDVSHMPQDTQEKQEGGSAAVVDTTSTSFDVGQAVFSPTTIITEQVKPTSASGLLDRDSALPDITERTETSQNGNIGNGDHTSLNVDHIHVENLTAPDVVADATPASTSVGTCNISFPSGESVSANCKPINECLPIFDGTSQTVCISHKEASCSEAPAITVDTTPPSTSVGPCNKPFPFSETVTANYQPTNACLTAFEGTSQSASASHTGCVSHKEASSEALAITVDTTPASTSMGTCNKPFPSSESVTANCQPINDCLTAFEGTSQSGCVSHKEASGLESLAKVGPGGVLSELGAHYGIDPKLRSVAAHEFNQDQSRCFLGSEATTVQHLVGPNKESYEHRHVLRACSSSLRQSDTVISVDRDFVSNSPHLLSTQAEPCSSVVLGRVEPVHASGISRVVQGEDCQPTSIRDAVLQANIISESVPSNCLAVDLGNLDTAISRNSQSGNLYGPTSSGFAVPEPESLTSAPRAVPYARSDFLSNSDTVNSKNSQSGNIYGPPSSGFAVREPERLPSAPTAVPFARSNFLGNLDTVISKNSQPGNLYGPNSSGFTVPEPEKLLSAPTAVPFTRSDFLAQWTSENRFRTEHEASANGFNTLSGKKRQVMESALVQPAGSSAKFFEMQSKTTVGFIPGEEDMLSSILVGRNSSALKLRPTPPQSGMTSKKRPRVTPRTSVAKRKVLLDDTVVLHGDTIRQQLTSTEDIRRIRKKAPCTRPEIWIIQKHLLEDGIFTESLFTGISSDLAAVHNLTYGVTDFRVSAMNTDHTLPNVPDKALLPKSTDLNVEPNIEGTGMSSDLVAVHNQTHEFTGFRASEMAVDHPLPEVADKAFLSQSTDLNVEPNAEGTGEAAVVGNGGGVIEPTGTENQLSEDHLIYPIQPDTQEETRPVTDIFPFELQKGQLDVTTRDGDSGNADMMGHTETDVNEPPLVDVERDRDSGAADMTGHGDTVVNEPSFVAGTVSEDRCNAAVGSTTESLPVDNSRIETVLQNDGKMDLESVEKDVFMMERSNDRVDDDVIHVEEVPCLTDGVPMEIDGPGLEITETGSDKVNPQDMPEDDRVEKTVVVDNELVENKADVVVESFTPMETDKPLVTNIDGSERSTSPTLVTNEGTQSEWGHVFREENVKEDSALIVEPQRELSRPLEINTNTETVGSDGGKDSGGDTEGTEKLNGDGANLGGTVDDETTLLENTSTNISPDLELNENDTEFLNFDDEDEDTFEEADNTLPTTEEAGILDNSGWSSRTRGVARFLQTQFDTESGHGRKSLFLDSLLTNKTRKEASRMFFETLVLKTRDYIQVEQEKPFEKINIKPLGKLVKSEF